MFNGLCASDFEVCNCPCHKFPTGTIQHAHECCVKCPHCAREINWHSYEMHLARCVEEKRIRMQGEGGALTKTEP